MVKDLNNSGLENVCRELAGAFPGILSWQWDNRFETVLAEFGVDNIDRVHATLVRNLGNIWDSSTIAKAPGIVQVIISHLGGLKSGQLLFTSDPSLETVIFCAWWPWGDGKTISIRFGQAFRELSDPQKSVHVKQFRDWFGI